MNYTSFSGPDRLDLWSPRHSSSAVIAADVSDAESVARATDGAVSVYHCANPLYFEWPKLLLPMTRGIVEGSRQSGANLLALDNLYMRTRCGRRPRGARNLVVGRWRLMLPVQPAETTREVIGRVYRVLGKDLGVARVPTWALRVMGLFNPSVRELVEMVYPWEQPYAVDDERIRRELGLSPTPWDEAIDATVAWGRAAFSTTNLG